MVVLLILPIIGLLKIFSYVQAGKQVYLPGCYTCSAGRVTTLTVMDFLIKRN